MRARGSFDDLLALAAELSQPTLISVETLRLATTVSFPGPAGVLPGIGHFDPLDWGLGFELRDGIVLAGEHPGHPDPGRASQKLAVLIDAGIRTFVDLTTPEDGLAPYQCQLDDAAGSRGIDVRRLSHPIPDLGTVTDPEYDGIIAAIRDETASGWCLCALLGAGSVGLAQSSAAGCSAWIITARRSTS